MQKVANTAANYYALCGHTVYSSRAEAIESAGDIIGSRRRRASVPVTHVEYTLAAAARFRYRASRYHTLVTPYCRELGEYIIEFRRS